MDDAINIDQLRVMHARGSEAAVVRQLEIAHWPRVGREYLFLRRVHLVSKVHDVGHVASRRAGELAGQARDGASVDARDADAVRFASLADVVACLSWDLVRGRAHDVWFWRPWQELFGVPVSDALERLWSRSPLELPAVTSRLERLGALEDCFRALGPDGATRLGQLLLRGFAPAPQVAMSATEARRNEPESRAPALLNEALPVAYRRRWLPMVSEFPRHLPQVRLAAIVILQAWRPTWLDSSLREVAIDRVVDALSQPGTPPGPNQAEVATARRGFDRTAPVHDAAPIRGDEAAAKSDDTLFGRSSAMTVDECAPDVQRVAAVNAPPPRVPVADAFNVESAADETAFEGQLPAGRPPGPRLDVARPAPTTSRDPSTETEMWLTHRGGVFYLVNFLDSAAAQAILCNSPEALAFPSGWAWLHHFSLAAGAELDAPLLDFFTRCAGLERARELQAAPPLPHTRQLLELARGRYEAAGIWTPDLFGVTARIERVDQYVDIHYAMRDLRLDVRRVGLDVDPGFVPWLGCVVRFHYGAEPTSNTRLDLERRRLG